jgi:hypothetical protein
MMDDDDDENDDDDDDDDDCGAACGLVGSGNRSARKNPAPLSLRPPQIPYDLIRVRTQTVATGTNRN